MQTFTQLPGCSAGPEYGGGASKTELRKIQVRVRLAAAGLPTLAGGLGAAQMQTSATAHTQTHGGATRVPAAGADGGAGAATAAGRSRRDHSRLEHSKREAAVNMPSTYCKVSVGGQERKTSIVRHSCSPSWRETVRLDVPVVEEAYGRQMLDPEAEMRVVIYSHDHLSNKSDTFMGAVVINLQQLRTTLRMKQDSARHTAPACPTASEGVPLVDLALQPHATAAPTSAALPAQLPSNPGPASLTRGGQAAEAAEAARLDTVEAFVRRFPLSLTSDKGTPALDRTGAQGGAGPGGLGAGLSATAVGLACAGDLIVDGVIEEYVVLPSDDSEHHHHHHRHREALVRHTPIAQTHPGAFLNPYGRIRPLEMAASPSVSLHVRCTCGHGSSRACMHACVPHPSPPRKHESTRQPR